MLKHCLPLKFPSFLVFFALLGIMLSCIRKISSSVTLAKRESVYDGHCVIIYLPGGGHCPLARDSEPIRLLEMPTSPSLYMITTNIVYITDFCSIEQNGGCNGPKAMLN